MAKQGRVQLAYCREMTAELARKLRFTFGYPENHIQSVLYELRHLAALVEISGTLHVVPADPDDDMFVECALLWQAD